VSNSKNEVLYFSTDIETDGPLPGQNSMLSFASVVFRESGEVVGSFERNTLPLPGAYPDVDTTVNFWDKEPEALAYVLQNRVDPSVAMTEYVTWVNSFVGKKVMVCYPSGFDFTFMYWYMKKFTGGSPFGFSCLDMRSYVSGMRKKTVLHSGKGSWPRRWASMLPHSHRAIDDALEQGLSFMLIHNENTRGIGVLDEVRSTVLRSWDRIRGN